MSSLSSSIPASGPAASSVPAGPHLQLHPQVQSPQHHPLHPLHLYRDSRDPRDMRDPRDSRGTRDSRDYEHSDPSRAGSNGGPSLVLAPLNSNIIYRPLSPLRKRKRDGEDIELADQASNHSAQLANAALRRRHSSPQPDRPHSSIMGEIVSSDENESGDSGSNSVASGAGSPSLSISDNHTPGPTVTTNLPASSRSYGNMPFSPGTPVTPGTPYTPGADGLITTAAGVRMRADRERKRKFARRTKTGCMTCRKRKKKCDELKPHCHNCSKGGFECEGYVGKVVWGGPRLGENPPDSARAVSTPLATPIAALGPGIENDDSISASMSTRSGRRGPPPPMILPDDGNRPLAVGPPPLSATEGPQLTPLNITHVLNDTTSVPKQRTPGGPMLTPSVLSARESDLRLRQPNSGPISHFTHHLSSALGQSAPGPGSYTAPPGSISFSIAPLTSGRSSAMLPPSSAATPSFARSSFFAHPPPPPPSAHQSGYGHMLPPPPQSSHLQPLPSPVRRQYSDFSTSYPYPSAAAGESDMNDRFRMIAGEPYNSAVARLAIDRVAARVSVFQYNASCDPRNGISLAERRRLFLRVLSTPEAREASHIALATGKPDESASLATAEISPAISRLGPDVEVGIGFRCLYGYNISIGSGTWIGDEVSLLDPCRIRIGSGVAIGDRVIIAGEVALKAGERVNIDANGESTNNHSSGSDAAGNHQKSQTQSQSQQQSQSQSHGGQNPHHSQQSIGQTDMGHLPSLQGKPVSIDDDVWIGPGAVIAAGVHIGKGARIGPGSVVLEDVPPGTTGAGNPFVPRR